MMQHLINTTAIWMLSLTVFDLFLRKESYHSYNRIYLLLTFMLGIFLPMVQWQDNDILHSSAIPGPVAMVVQSKQTIVKATTVETSKAINWVQWLWTIYWTGVAISALLLLKEVIILSRYFKIGTKTNDGNWHIVETSRQHGPFSIFRYIFIGSMHDYKPTELQMILTHEKQHGRSLHSIDMCLMEAAKIIFWFHPCVYLFERRLRILHEYQADAAVENEPQEYGTFLIQQSLLQTAPPLSHSLNRSPIKNRILMLTRTSSFKAGFKRLVAIPLCIACIFLFTETAISGNTNESDNKLYYNGNVFEMQPKKFFPDYIMNSAQYNMLLHTTGVPDSMTGINPRTGAIETVAAFIITYPAKMNGREIFAMSDLPKAERDEITGTTITELNQYLLEKLAPVINKWEKGYYDLYDYLIIDETGKLVYMHPGRFDENSLTPLVRERMRSLWKALQDVTINADVKFTPAKRNGKPVIIRLGRQALQIKSYNASVIEPGC